MSFHFYTSGMLEGKINFKKIKTHKKVTGKEYRDFVIT